METKLLDSWRYFMKDIKSPNSYIDMGFYFMISAALQRRVWVGPKVMPMFPNMYMVFVGPPAVGKGRVLKPIINIIKEHRMNEIQTKKNGVLAEDTTMYIKDLADKAGLDMSPLEGAPKKHLNDFTDKLLIPIAPESTSFEQLLIVMGRNLRIIPYKELNAEGKEENKAYTHRSLCFILEEISSLFRKNQDTTIKFLLNAFDCGDFDHETKNKGIDLIRNMCLNLLGGTTVSFLEESFDDKLLGDGFSSRVIFVYEKQPRSIKYGFADINESQLAAREEVSQHIKKLATLYGPIRYSREETPEAFEVMREYFEDILPQKRGNSSEKLDSYYGRKDIHSLKLAIAVHFSHSLKMEIFPEDCIEALRLLDNLEQNMHYALDFDKNPLAKPAKSILAYLRRSKRGMSQKELLGEFYGIVRETELAEVLNFLLATGKIETKEDSVNRRILYHALTKQGISY